MANIYDGAFRTILSDCRKLIIPVINEIFGETYTGEEEIQFWRGYRGNIDCDIPQYRGSVSSDLQKDTGQNEICYHNAGRDGAV